MMRCSQLQKAVSLGKPVTCKSDSKLQNMFHKSFIHFIENTDILYLMTFLFNNSLDFGPVLFLYRSIHLVDRTLISVLYSKPCLHSAVIFTDCPGLYSTVVLCCYILQYCMLSYANKSKRIDLEIS